MMQTQIQLEDNFLATAQKESSHVTVFLMNGYQIRGVITGFDATVVVLTSDAKQQFIYKHAISTIIPEHPIGV